MRLNSPRCLLCTALNILTLLVGLSVASFTFAQSDPAIPSGHIRIHYHRPDSNYNGWTVYAFYDTTENTGDYGEVISVSATRPAFLFFLHEEFLPLKLSRDR